MNEPIEPKKLIGYALYNNTEGTFETGLCESMEKLNEEIEILDMGGRFDIEILSLFSTGKKVVNRNVIVDSKD